MPDFVMCQGSNCPDKEQCQRHTASPYIEDQQTWSSMYEDRKEGKDCTFFMSNYSKDCPEIVQKSGLNFVQVCVPDNWTDLSVVNFAKKDYPCRTSSGWAIRKQKDIRKKNTKEREPCQLRKSFVHIILHA